MNTESISDKVIAEFKEDFLGWLRTGKLPGLSSSLTNYIATANFFNLNGKYKGSGPLYLGLAIRELLVDEKLIGFEHDQYFLVTEGPKNDLWS